MTGVITDIIQSTSIIVWAVIMFSLIRRVNRLDERFSSWKFIKDYQVSRQLEDQPVCGCGHHQCFHDENSCGKSEQLIDRSQYKVVSCGCKRYTGPEPLPTVIP